MHKPKLARALALGGVTTTACSTSNLDSEFRSAELQAVPLAPKQGFRRRHPKHREPANPLLQ